MKRVALMLALVLLGCGPKKPPKTVPVPSVDTLVIAYLGNIQNLLLPESENLLARRLANSQDIPTFTIASFVPLDGLTQSWYERLSLEQFLNQVYAGVLIVPAGFLAAEAADRGFAVLDPAGGSLVRNLKFGRVGFISVPAAGVSDLVYFQYRKNLSILKARSDFVMALSERPDSVSDTLVYFSIWGQPRVSRLLITDRKVRSIENANFEIVRTPPDSQIEARVAGFRTRFAAWRAETLFVHESNDEAFKKYTGRKLQEYFEADMVILPSSLFKERLERGRRVFTIDTLARYVDGKIQFAKSQCFGAEAKSLAKGAGNVVVGTAKKETALVQVTSSGTSLFDIIVGLASRR